MSKQFATEIADIVEKPKIRVKMNTYSFREQQFKQNGSLGTPHIQIPNPSIAEPQLESVHRFTVQAKLASNIIPEKIGVFFCKKQRAHWWTSLDSKGEPCSRYMIGPFWYQNDMWLDIEHNFSITRKDDLERLM